MSEPAAAAKAVQIIVNKSLVTLPDRHTTGYAIKEAAISAGVQIELSFQLSVKHGPHQTQIIGDAETITIHDGLVFVAVAGDDNS
jgi:Multiubiquitin